MCVLNFEDAYQHLEQQHNFFATKKNDTGICRPDKTYFHQNSSNLLLFFFKLKFN